MHILSMKCSFYTLLKTLSDLDCVQHFQVGRLRLRIILRFVSMMQCSALTAHHLCLYLIMCSNIS